MLFNMADTKVWDELSQYFNVHGDEIDPGAADNILIAWPPMLTLLEESVPKGGRILEYGCGTGGLVKKLSSLDYSVTGIDPAPKMIEVAKSYLKAELFVGDADAIPTDTKFDAITAVMVFQFEPDIESALKKLASHLNPGGIVTFAVFNPEFVHKGLAMGYLFRDFENEDDTGKGTMDFGSGRTTDVYIRSASEYDAVMAANGLTKVLEEYPPFTKEFLEKYPTGGPTDVSEFLVLGYKKV